MDKKNNFNKLSRVERREIMDELNQLVVICFQKIVSLIF